MTGLVILISVILLGVVLVQIGKINEITDQLRGEEESKISSYKKTATALLIFLILFLIFCIASAIYYKNYMLGYGPHESASEHGVGLDSMFDITLVITGIVFFLTQIALFWFSYKYKYEPGRKALYMPHDNKLEIIWTAIPAVVMTYLVIKGLVTWNAVMSDVKKGEYFMEVEATGYQFAWNLRYPGADNELGVKDFRLIKPGVNEIGQDWTDVRNHDDFNANDLVLPVGKKIRVRITARDVLHNFYLPHFRVKMDAVPGIPTYFIFTPSKTTEQYRMELKKYPEYNVPSDPNDPNSAPLWKNFEYELACAELCGNGHYSMKKIVKVVSEEEYKRWAVTQQSHYLSSIRNTDEDPFKGKNVEAELKIKSVNLKSAIEKASTSTNIADKTLNLDNIYFETGSAKLNTDSKYALDVILEAFNKYPTMRVDIGGHTDNTGDASANLSLSQQRAQAVKEYLIQNGVAAGRMSSNGFGQTKPIGDNSTDAGRAQNRRIEFKFLSF